MEQWNNENVNNQWNDSTNSEPTYGAYDTYDSSTATTENSNPKDGLCVASLVLSIIGFFVNPLYVCSILGIIFGIVGMQAKGEKAGIAKWGMIIGIISIFVHFGVDMLLMPLTMGASFCC